MRLTGRGPAPTSRPSQALGAGTDSWRAAAGLHPPLGAVSPNRPRPDSASAGDRFCIGRVGAPGLLCRLANAQGGRKCLSRRVCRENMK